MREIGIHEMYIKLDEETKDYCQNNNFDLKSFAIQNQVQELYDKVFINGNKSFEEKAKLDLIYTYIEEVIRQGEELLSEEKNQ